MCLSDLFMALSMNKTTQAILEEHVHLSRLYQSCYFSDTKHLMCHGLPCTVRECPVIRGRGFNRRTRQRSRSEFERADCAALRTTHTRNLPAFIYRRHRVSTFLITHCAELISSVAYVEYLLLHWFSLSRRL